jgi:hypothetical protein
MTTGPARILILLLLPGVLTSCAASPPPDGLDPSTIPGNLRADYGVFAQRCSKCHSLSRPLNSGITDDAYWSMYVERMRRQPASGISPEDTGPILRFLRYYSADPARQKERTAPPASSAPTTSRAPLGRHM